MAWLLRGEEEGMGEGGEWQEGVVKWRKVWEWKRSTGSGNMVGDRFLDETEDMEIVKKHVEYPAGFYIEESLYNNWLELTLFGL